MLIQEYCSAKLKHVSWNPGVMRQALTRLALMKYGLFISFEVVQCQCFVKNKLVNIYDFKKKVF